MQHSVHLQSELDTIEERHRQELDILEQDRLSLVNQLEEQQQTNSSLSAQIQNYEQQVIKLEELLSQLQQKFEECDRQRQDALAQIRALLDELAISRQELENRYMEIQQGINRQQDLEKDIEGKQVEIDQIKQYQLQSQEELRVQKDLNKQVMKRKEEMEWELMKALAPSNQFDWYQKTDDMQQFCQNDENKDPQEILRQK
eukprot:TRINITY_DN8922_c0_g1_i2.p2 TRINITY_DN8922_c0_g1~~TRINITY_DN8922_c0_g1_i2.p2  ORF type:complete len:201 (-),score=40.00 TRINITY_DN8922_c0_g1_i2:112-714(-)